MKIRALFLGLGLLFTSGSMACTCGGRSLEADYKDATAMVEGRVTGRKIKKYRLTLENREVYSFTYFVYTIRVKQVHKGQPGKLLRVATAREGTTCGMRFKMGRWYLVSAFPDERYGLYTSSCSTNIRRREMYFKQEIAALRKLAGKG